MTIAEPPAVSSPLNEFEGELRAVLADSEQEIGALVRDFEGLAAETSLIVDAAGIIVGFAESERMSSVLPRLQLLGSAAKNFIRDRLAATAGILETVTAEAALLEKLAQLTRGQRAIVRETDMLRVLTNIEVARLGDVGTGFQYLAHELDDFSRAVALSTNELTTKTEERRKAVEATKHTLKVELPQMRVDLARIRESLDTDMGMVEGMIGQLRQTPLRFRACAEQIASEVAGVVAAVQAHDITRQQIEHVCEALAAMAVQPTGQEAGTSLDRVAEMQAGLTIQSYQLRNAQETVRGWVTQIGTCLAGIARIASSEILELAPLVLGQEKALSVQVARIETLERECEAGNARVQASFSGIAGLMELVGEHLARSKSVRDRLQLLMFNSTIEASHLGTQADGILEISTAVKRISAAWGEITAQSEAAAKEIRTLVEASRESLEAFSDGSNEALRDARSQTHAGLGILRDAAECTDRKGRAIQISTQVLQQKIAVIGAAAQRLESCFARLAPTVAGIESAKLQMARKSPSASGWCDTEAMKERYGSNYTTEMERVVLRAALAGGPLPIVQQNFAGNSVELF